MDTALQDAPPVIQRQLRRSSYNLHKAASGLIMKDAHELMRLRRSFEDEYNFPMSTYSHPLGYAPILRDLLLALGDLNGKRIFEIGCCSGEFLRILANYGAEVEGIALEGAVVNAARRIGLSTVRQGDFFTHNLSDSGKFDAVISKGFLDPRVLDPEFDGDFELKLNEALKISYNLTQCCGSGVHICPLMTERSERSLLSTAYAIGYKNAVIDKIHYREKPIRTLLFLEK
jgi:SAM-dependent methyltransferase